MSIYSIMAFNAAVKQAQENDNQLQAVQAKKVQTQQAQEELDLNKKLDEAKVSQANNEKMVTDYVGSSLKKNINDSYKAKQDQLDATAGLQDIQEHKSQQALQQATQTATQLHQNDPDVQAHVQTLAGIMATQMNNPQGQNPATPDQQQATPGVAPVQGGVSPQNVTNQIMPQAGAPAESPQAPAPQQVAPQAAPVAQDPQAQNPGAIDLSPIENAYGAPKGSMWLNPGTGKPEINPIWKSRVEKEQAAKATYDQNQPFREELREDRNVRAATSVLANAVKSGPIAVQNTKVDQAIHARALINQAYDPSTGQYNVSQVPYAELAESLGSLLAGATGSSESRINAIKQRTMAGDVNGALTYITGKPSNATSQDAIKQLVGMIDRQGETAEDLRNNAYDKMKKAPIINRLSDDDFEYIKSQLPNPGNSFRDELSKAPDKQPLKPKSTVGAKDYSSLWK